ncbi:MAG TPA: DUF1003 domain-containing protein [Bryobacteraceae bacterium]|nr:DUF1003 domain-containing protein [Bryobacteraceae bacterium]
MSCPAEVLREIPLFALLDDDELAVLGEQVERKTFSVRQRIFKIGDPSERAYLLISGTVVVSTIDEDNQEVVFHRPGPGEFFGFASMLEQTPHQTNAIATEESICVEVDRHDLFTLLERKPHAGIDLLTVLSRQIHDAQALIRSRATRNANEVIEEQATRPEEIADAVARFGGSWSFIITFALVLIVYSTANIWLAARAWDPYPFILLNLFLSMLAAIQAPVIMMSQNRQDKKDRLRSELDFEVNRRAETEIQGLASRMNLMNEKMDDLGDLMRELHSGRSTAHPQNNAG